MKNIYLTTGDNTTDSLVLLVLVELHSVAVSVRERLFSVGLGWNQEVSIEELGGLHFHLDLLHTVLPVLGVPPLHVLVQEASRCSIETWAGIRRGRGELKLGLAWHRGI